MKKMLSDMFAINNRALVCFACARLLVCLDEYLRRVGYYFEILINSRAHYYLVYELFFRLRMLSSRN